MRKTFFFLSLALVIFLGACTPQNQEADTTDTPVDTTATNEWITLFDGTSTAGWRGFNRDTLPAGWTIEDGALKTGGQGGEMGGDIIYADQQFDNFELMLDWKLTAGGNSGVFYHVVEGDDYEAAYFTGPEFQLIDDTGYPDQLTDKQLAGGDYDMYAADSTKQVNPPGEWNSARVIYQPNHVEYWLNGKKVVEFDPTSEDWKQRRANSKWKDFPDYAKAKSGYIGLQDHGSPVWFRNIKVREL